MGLVEIVIFVGGLEFERRSFYLLFDTEDQREARRDPRGPAQGPAGGRGGRAAAYREEDGARRRQSNVACA